MKFIEIYRKAQSLHIFTLILHETNGTIKKCFNEE